MIWTLTDRHIIMAILFKVKSSGMQCLYIYGKGLNCDRPLLEFRCFSLKGVKPDLHKNSQFAFYFEIFIDFENFQWQ